MAPADSRPRLAVAIGAPAVVLAGIVVSGAYWLDAQHQAWLLFGCTLVSVSTGAALFWLSDHELGWVTLAAVLLAVTPLAVGRAADEVVLASSGHLDSCVVTGVDVEPGLTDAFRSVRFRHELDCLTSGSQEMDLATRSGHIGQRLAVWLDDTSRRGTVARGTGAPSTSGDVLLALAVLLGLAVSGGAAVRELGRRPDGTSAALGLAG